MTTETQIDLITEPPRRRTDEILAMLAERVGGRFTASTVFGSPGNAAAAPEAAR
jgi:hypothetical protein